MAMIDMTVADVDRLASEYGMDAREALPILEDSREMLRLAFHWAIVMTRIDHSYWRSWSAEEKAAILSEEVLS